ENETENLALDAEITWEPAANASAYRVYIGTSAGATNITNGEEVTELTYIPTDGWDENETYYVTVVPFNAAGEAEGCSEISFTTTTLLTAPECTSITGPADGATDVDLNTGITWASAEGADGYRIYIGTSAGATDIANGEEVTELTYTPTGGWDEDEPYYYTALLFTAAGEAEGCSEISFTTTTLLT